jgi:L-proline amide hydrolase
MRWEGLATWYRVIGDRHGAVAPVVVCHGGPGLTHDYLMPVADLARSGRACVLYDQFGNGRSGHRPEAPAGFWTVDLFLRELETLIATLDIADAFHIVGHSWGGMLALEFALRHPAGLRSIVLADTFASSAVYSAEVARLLRQLPEEVRAAIERSEAAGTTDAPEYQNAVREFYRRHVCRRRPVPDEVMRTLVALGQDPTVYQTMCGPSEFSLTGSLADWDITGMLRSIDVPVLIVSGRHDEVTPAAIEPLRRGLPDVRWELFEESSHMPHIEEPERFLDVVESFLQRVDHGTPS